MGVEKLLDTQTLSGLLAAITVTSALHLLSRLAEFAWRLREKKDATVADSIEKLSDAVGKSTIATERLDSRLKTLESTLVSVSKVRRDVRRLFAVVKILSGDRWETVKRQVKDDDDEENAA